ncbi:beta-ketoacyl-[acyl-carrier-protein] synthase family protein [Jejudonia soesokkakensis]|uniref:3-oxoacyl-[acyl-carrier-protein] synthase 1 n=1 Tax=Jejudonia soesokkakensis TaxID=1323432 RepID=A0ABW2MTE8_9FLAO
MKRNRVVVTGLGVVAPNGVSVSEFNEAIQQGKSGIEYFPHLKELNFSCCIGGIPKISEEKKRDYFTELQLRNFNSSGILYGVIAAMDAIYDAGITIDETNPEPNWDLGIVFGTGSSGVDKFKEAIYKLDAGKVRRLGSTAVVQTMMSGVTAYLTGMTGAGNMVTTNSTACATGTEAILIGHERIASGKATQMLCGSTNDSGELIWGGFDALKVITYKHNDSPTEGSRPMSETASGFVPGSGAGALFLESLESAQKRGAKIYAEVLGGSVNSGGQRGEGSMTAPNSIAVQRCITDALKDSGVEGKDIDYINGHLTATLKDPLEIKNWCDALGRTGSDFPYINSLKSMIGHSLAASGSIEAVSTILQLHHGYVFPSINSEDLHPEIAQMIAPEKIPQKKIAANLNIVAKASFGFGDVNACVIFGKNIR